MSEQPPSITPVHRIGQAAQRCGVSAANIRYYEREGLLAPQARADNDYRLYSEDDVHRLRFIRLCRAMDSGQIGHGGAPGIDESSHFTCLDK